MFRHGQIVDAAGKTLFRRAVAPVGYFARLRGLLGRKPLADDEAWWFTRCSAVHTVGMSFAIDVVHLDREGRVLRVRAGLSPFSYSGLARSGHVLELNGGAAQRAGIGAGQVLRFMP